MPATHWAARLSILFVLAAVVFAGVFTGALRDTAYRATACGTRIVTGIWAPLQDAGRAAPAPVSGCWGDPVR